LSRPILKLFSLFLKNRKAAIKTKHNEGNDAGDE